MRLTCVLWGHYKHSHVHTSENCELAIPVACSSELIPNVKMNPSIKTQ